MENIALFDLEGDPGPSVKKERLWALSSRLQRKTLIFFALLILMASVLSIITIYHHNQGEVAAHIGGIAVNGTTSPNAAATAGAEAARSHAGLEDGLTIMALALAGALIIFMFFFIGNIITPLRELEKMTGAMADGRLDRLVANRRQTGCCSIAAIGENVNTMAMNLQEVLLLVWNFSEHNLTTIEHTLATLAGDDEISTARLQGELQTIQAELRQMQDLAKQFELFDVTLQGKKALAKDEQTNSQPY
jgi:methyl-accepting chemotaxis protein